MRVLGATLIFFPSVLDSFIFQIDLCSSRNLHVQRVRLPRRSMHSY